MAKKTAHKKNSRQTISRKKPARKKAVRTPAGALSSRKLSQLIRLLDAPKPDSRALFDLDNSLCQSVWPEEVKHGFDALTLPRRRFLACFMLEAEVNNGGFLQFFDNQGPAVAKEALAFLEDRGPRSVAALLRRAIKSFPGGKLPRNKERLLDITIADISEDGDPGPITRKLGRVDEAFFDAGPSQALIRARLEYAHDYALHFFA